MTRRTPTAEQKAKAAERRARFTELAKKVAAMSDEDRAGLVDRLGAIVTVEGRTLSPFNSCLILMQRDNASMVGGFQQWKAHGRSVSKGEHGLMIWIPTARTTGEESAPSTEEVEAEAGEGETKSRRRFVMGTMFDITQTHEIGDEPAAGAAGPIGPGLIHDPLNPVAKAFVPNCPECGVEGFISAGRCAVCGHTA